MSCFYNEYYKLMKLVVKVRIACPPDTVYKYFDKELFLALAPPLSGLKLIRFEGSRPGNYVELKMGPPMLKMRWISIITDEHISKDFIWFTDQGIKLPFFLKSWHHKHIIKKDPNGSEIIEDITFSTGTKLTDHIVYPLLYMQFAWRKKAYPAFFRKVL